ncbi:myo-inositol-1(or 4)-monophosphatase [Kribbella sp. VKM Ac-2569]|uniref:inositol monophosphatase family protein n=1 Tax=Kribbella sp. VKM Ac-2569 TaxID=2512220 RepID=UPI0010CFDABB|nr:inositol monophosphatase family protein [Kribbella sp. VKM Ac-2569]RZT27533.1 myo-inositol-1(or 4)-monophosphatase [Kribbella sp. VKM Ac-2569]
MTNFDTQHLLDIARSSAQRAGQLAAEMRADGISVESTKSNRLDIVTQADTAVESLIRKGLAVARPDDGFLGEEGDPSDGTSGITWVVDPIDGTVNYLYGSPYYAVSIAATILEPDGRRRTLAGCVFAPELDAEYTATTDQPALLNGRELYVDDQVTLDNALVATGFPYDHGRRDRVLAAMSGLAPKIRDFRLNGAASLEICAVADGRLNAVFLWDLPIWDYAAAALIATRAGARVQGGRDSPRTPLLLAAHPLLADTITPHLKEIS